MASPHRPSSKSRASPPPPTPTLSLEAALDQDRRDVMAALEGRRTLSPAPRKSRPSTPPPPVRSMLDIDTPTPRHGSIAGIGVGVTTPSGKVRSPKPKLDPSDPSTYTSRHKSFSQPTSPPNLKSAHPHSTHEIEGEQRQGLPKVPDDQKKDFDQDYQFDMFPTVSKEPLRATQAGKRPREGSGNAMAAALSGDFSSLHVGMPAGKTSSRHNSSAGIGGKSTSPPSHTKTSDTALLSPKSPPAKYVTESGKVIDMDRAYRRLSNKSGSSFSTINSSSEEGARVTKDPLEPHDENDVAISSDEDEDPTSSDDDLSAISRGRERDRGKSSPSSIGSDTTEKTGVETPVAMGQAGGSREPQSQMAAAEQERKQVSSTQTVKSLLEPSISVTSPSGESLGTKKSGVRPNNNFDHTTSAVTSAASSEGDPELEDISKARKLGINVSAVDKHVPDRVAQVILRGDWQAMQEEVEDGRRRARLYLVATDLSDQAVYALEWTIGTILRDGDTLLAIYAIEDENAAGKPGEGDRDALHAEGTKMAQDTARTMKSLTEKTKQNKSTTLAPMTFLPATDAESVTGSVDSRRLSRAHMERLRAVEGISQTCLKFLRRTRLQVRVMIEVINCKSPKHLITGAIDELDPTLVVLGSRGRSALKGVLLGSFSNYLVTKSSVPVMVARKKLKKHSKVRGTHVRLTNNLQTPNTPVRRKSLKDANIEYNPMKRK